jgi:hypothetical protein
VLAAGARLWSLSGKSERNEEVHAATASLLRASDTSASDDAKRFSSSEIVMVLASHRFDPPARQCVSVGDGLRSLSETTS